MVCCVCRPSRRKTEFYTGQLALVHLRLHRLTSLSFYNAFTRLLTRCVFKVSTPETIKFVVWFAFWPDMCERKADLQRNVCEMKRSRILVERRLILLSINI